MGSSPPVMMANLGMADTLILMVLALVVFGPRRLPQIGRQIGKLMYEFRKASNDFKFQMEEELRQAEEADRRKKEEAERQRALAAPPPPQLEQTTSASAESAIKQPDAETPAAPESPYASETTSANTSAETAVPAAESAVESPLQSAPADTAPSVSPEPAHPRIAPPTTGEKVAAERPGAQQQQQELFASDTGKAPESVTPEAERSEPAAHHG